MSDTLADKTRDAVNNVGGAGASDRIEGSVHETVGQGKQALGDALGDENLRAQGDTQVAEGKTQQAVGAVKDKTQEFAETAKEKFEETSAKVKEGFGNAMDRVKDAIDGNHSTEPRTE